MAALAPYDAALARDFAAYLVQHARYYAMEERWREAPFWTRRSLSLAQAPPTRSAGAGIA